MTQIITTNWWGWGGGWASYTAWCWIDITCNEISVDTSIVAQVSDIPTDNCQLANGCWYQTVSCMVCDLTGADDCHYPTALAVANAISWWGGWDMMKSVYDPNNHNADAFDYCNFTNTPDLSFYQERLTCCNAGQYIAIWAATEQQTVTSTNTIAMTNAISLDSVTISWALSQDSSPTPASPKSFTTNNWVLKVDWAWQIYADWTAETVTDGMSNTATAEMLLAFNTVKDTQEILTWAVTRKVWVKALNGTETTSWTVQSNRAYTLKANLGMSNAKQPSGTGTDNFKSTHFSSVTINNYGNVLFNYTMSNIGVSSVTDWNNFLATQYANWTPVMIVYPLTSETTETVTGQTLQAWGTNTLTLTSNVANPEWTAVFEVASADVTISSTLECKASCCGGGDVSLVTTWEKYTWDNKVDSSALSCYAQTCDIPTDNCQLCNGCWYTTCTWTLTASNISNTSYGSSWSGVTTVAPSKNAVYAKVNSIDELIPSAATCSNKLTDKNYVDDSINSVTAYYITKDAQGDQWACYAELASASTYYSWGVQRTPTRNDYTIVLDDECYCNATTRYIYNSGWEYQYTVNETALTCAQLDALNSGITSAKVSCYDNCMAQCCDIPTDNCQLCNGCWYTTCTWTLSTCADVVSALWYTPYNCTNPSWYTTCTWTLTAWDLTVVSWDTGCTYTIKVSNTAPWAWTPNTTITFVTA